MCIITQIRIPLKISLRTRKSTSSTFCYCCLWAIMWIPLHASHWKEHYLQLISPEFLHFVWNFCANIHRLHLCCFINNFIPSEYPFALPVRKQYLSDGWKVQKLQFSKVLPKMYISRLLLNVFNAIKISREFRLSKRIKENVREWILWTYSSLFLYYDFKIEFETRLLVYRNDYTLWNDKISFELLSISRKLCMWMHSKYIINCIHSGVFITVAPTFSER